MPPNTETGGTAVTVTASSSAGQPASSASPPVQPQSKSTGPSAASTPTSNSGTCFTGTFSVVFPATDNPVRTACVHMGTAVNVELLALRGVTWAVPSVSDPSVASVSDEVTPPGTRHDHINLLRPGTVTLTSLSTYNPDPHGPPSRQWTLTLVVVS